MALAPEDMDFISNFSTLWAVFLGAILATLGGFAATQMEWYLDHKRRERNAALFFGEVLATLSIILGMAERTRQIGDPFGPITMRMFRSALGEIEIYNRNRETLYDISKPDLRARIHTLILRITMSIDGISDTTTTLVMLEPQLEDTTAPAERARLEARIALLKQNRQGACEFVQESADNLKIAIRELEPIANFSYEQIEKAVRNNADL
ncbi:MAG TPA: hypothetical protein VG387_19320 [Rhizomicrobium sp.]|nr:hypothetical protein [Rhizomicrobium sp.]